MPYWNGEKRNSKERAMNGLLRNYPLIYQYGLDIMNAMFNVLGIWSAIWNFHARKSRLSRMRSIKRNFNPSAEREIDFLHRVALSKISLIADNGRTVADVRSPSTRTNAEFRITEFGLFDRNSRDARPSRRVSRRLILARTIDPRIPRPRALRAFDLRSGEIVSKSCQAVVWPRHAPRV